MTTSKGKHAIPQVAGEPPSFRKIAQEAHFRLTEAVQDLKAHDGPQLDDAIAHIRYAQELLKFFTR